MYLTLKRAAGGKKRGGGGGGVTSGLGVERENARVWHGVGGWGGGKSQVTSIETGLGKPWEGGGGDWRQQGDHNRSPAGHRHWSSVITATAVDASRVCLANCKFLVLYHKHARIVASYKELYRMMEQSFCGHVVMFLLWGAS